MINLTEEQVLELTRMANEHSGKVIDLYRKASRSISHTPYRNGVMDGVENTSYSSFMSGAKAVIKLLNKSNAQTNSF